MNLRGIVFIFLLNFTVSVSANTQHDIAPNLLAFEGAMGFGKYTQGGNNGEVLIVTSLDDGEKNQAGTLRWAVSQPFPRLVVFDVSGIIELKRPLEIKHDNITIAGQTSPKGIVVKGAETQVKANQVIIRHMRFRPGRGEGESDALFIRNQQDVIIDHCSLSWANDEVGSFYNNTRFTLQNSILSESLNNAGHSKGEHGYGGIWGGNYASFIQNVVVSHTSRTPRINGWRLGSPYPQEEEFVDIRNNVIANWGTNSSYGGKEGRANLVANYFQPGPASKKIRFFQLWAIEDALTRLHIHNNYMHDHADMTQNNLLGLDVKNAKRNEEAYSLTVAASVSLTPFESEAITLLNDETLTPQETWNELVVSRNVGATKTRTAMGLDPVDSRMLEQLKNNQYTSDDGIIDDELEVVDWLAYASYFSASQTSQEALSTAQWRQLSELK